MSHSPEQFQIEGLEFRVPVHVPYLRAEKNPSRTVADRLLGRRAVRIVKGGELSESIGVVCSDDITKENFADPDLRYALRFAAACFAQGWIETSPGCSKKSDVIVTMVEKAADSELVNAQYLGEGDRFLDLLRLADPRTS